jgi:hypothetical protein
MAERGRQVAPQVPEEKPRPPPLGHVKISEMERPDLKFGTVNQWHGHYGFVQDRLTDHRSFIHVSVKSTIRDSDLSSCAAALKKYDQDAWRDTHAEAITQICFWYVTENTKRGPRVEQLWSHLDDVPRKYVIASLHALIDSVSELLPEWQSEVITWQLFSLPWLPSQAFEPLVASSVLLRDPVRTLSLLPKVHHQAFASRLRLEDQWLDLSTQVTASLVQTSQLILSAERLSELQQERTDREQRLTEAERERQETEVRRQREMLRKRLENETRAIATLHRKFQINPKGIRNVEELRDVCLQCGPGQLVTGVPVRKCGSCRSEWYVNHCWNCAGARVDSRDPETPACRECGWQKCRRCNACHYLGCTTNPYHKDNRLSMRGRV